MVLEIRCLQESTFNSPSKLAEAVMLANTPRELRSEMVNRINSSHKNQNNQLEKSDGGKVLGIPEEGDEE